MAANLPNRQTFVKGKICLFGYGAFVQNRDFCHMDKQHPNRLKSLRDERDLTIEQVAEATGLSVSYVSRLENGERNLSVKNLNLFAHALNVEPQAILIKSTEPKRHIVRVMGSIGAGAEILPDDEQVPPEGLYEIEPPFPLPEDAIAFEVRGDSMWPRYDDGDIVICWAQSVVADEALGLEAAVKTSDGRRFLKRVLRGATQGTYDLESHNAPPIRGVGLTWVSGIQSVIRSGQWKKASSSERNRLVAKMTGIR
ncbi:XRE family transcriptional regulator [Agrobacterium rosae]|nr:LexA family transcriptional regulator [Agrobacterium rosae]